MKKLLLAAAMFFLAACAPTVSEEDMTTTTHERIERYEDAEAGVVCWLAYGYKEVGISCLPKKETKLFGK